MSDLATAIGALIPTHYLTIVTGIISVAAAIAAVLPPPANPALLKVFGLLNILALNVGNAKNAAQVEKL